MKLSDFTILFAAIFMCFFLVYSYNVDLSTEAAHEEMDYSQMLTAACYDAVGDLTVANHNNAVFTKETIQRAIDTYFNTLKINMGVFDSPQNADLVSLYSPVVCIVDNDGFYINYLTSYVDSTGAVCQTRVTTPKQGWAIGYGNYTVMLGLGDMVEVVNKATGEYYWGNYHKVYEQTGIYFLSDSFTYAGNIQSSFQEYKKKYIINEITDAMEYYVSNHNFLVADYHLNYTFELPAISSSYWSQLLTGPAIIGFLQGIPVKGGTFINIYSSAGSHVVKDTGYYIVDGIYHRRGCEILELYGYNKEYTSAEECASSGAYPCNICNP